MGDFLRIAGVFVLIIVLLRLKMSLAKVMLIAAAVMGLLFRLAPASIVTIMFRSSLAFSTINLALALVLIMFLENIMRRTGLLARMVNSLRILVGDSRVVMAILPAIVGLLPSAGGAVFSAPLVEEVSRDTEFSAERKSFINYWYRHVWEYIFPLYPSIILAAEIVKVPIYQLIAVQFPFSVSSVLLGIPVAFWHEKKSAVAGAAGGRGEHLRTFITSIAPALAVIVLVLAVKLEISLALAMVVLILLLINRYDRSRIVTLVKEAFSANTILMVVAVIIFKDILMATGAVTTLPLFFASLGLPPELVVIVLPFIVGMATGMSQAFVATTFPILLGLSAGGAVDLRLVALGYVSGFAGVMLSPVHLCLILTVEALKADLGKVYRMVLAPGFAQITFALLIYYLF